ncbi:MAG: hypothetical protein JOZ98_20900 [Solirubrobacterales bacterium]|nr:hypothetical protein [Solirubrobacterales bacterium]MBV9799815.1 hypothetical protein [Solirubrobacterales bacterium]
MSGPVEDFKAIWHADVGDVSVGHDHFWERGLSRRQVIGGTAGLGGLAAASRLGLPALASADNFGPAEPRPIPGGTTIDGLGTFHFFFPTSPNPAGSRDTVENGRGDPSLITDFRGSIGVGEWSGGTGKDQHGTTLFWAADVRFMEGEFIALDGRRRVGAFAFL